MIRVEVELESTESDKIFSLPLSRSISKDGSVNLLALRYETIWSVARGQYPDLPEKPPREEWDVAEIFDEGEDLILGQGKIQDHGWLEAMGLRNIAIETHDVIVPDAAIRSIYLENRTVFL